MNLDDFPRDIASRLVPTAGGNVVYRCLGCSKEYAIDQLLYTCPECGGLLMLPDKDFNRLKKVPGALWRKIFDYRKMLNHPGLKGIFLYHEFIAPTIALDSVIYLGEGHTPLVRANQYLQEYTGVGFYFKNDGQNPSASFKDRGMACALSYLNHLIKSGGPQDILSICASTGDTSAAAALYSSYLAGTVKPAVLLPHKKVTPQQLSQPLGAGARVFEIPGVFDDCMKVVEYLADHYNVALLNSKNAWRIRGQESYSYEISQWFEYDLRDKVVVVPIGNAGNVTAVINGFLKFHAAGVIEELPKIVGVQSTHADPVYRYYLEPDTKKREFKPVTVKPSVAQAAMIGNPVSMPRVIDLVQKYNDTAGQKKIHFVEVAEQEIMDCQLLANRNGHIICTQGGMALAGMIAGLKQDLIRGTEVPILDSTAHDLKFAGFREMYNDNSFPEEFEIKPKKEFTNHPVYLKPALVKKVPAQGKVLRPAEFEVFVRETAKAIAQELKLQEK